MSTRERATLAIKFCMPHVDVHDLDELHASRGSAIPMMLLCLSVLKRPYLLKPACCNLMRIDVAHNMTKNC